MVELKIDTLGRQGDGIGNLNGKDVFVPFTLPGERVRVSQASNRPELIEVLEPSSKRISPVCDHFGNCGGCQLQHMAAEAYISWKHKQIGETLTGAGIDFNIEPVISFPTASRRKAVFNACRVDGNLIFGFAKKNSNQIVDIEQCPVLVGDLHDRLPELRELIASLPLGGKPVRIVALATSNGPDVQIDGPLKLTAAHRKALTQKAVALKLARLSLEDEILIEVAKPFIPIGIAKVTPPPGGFVQAVHEAELVMTKLVFEHLGRCKNVADLYAGVGTFALRLAEKSTLYAVEENASALNALDRAWRETGGKLKQVKTEARNLERRPVSYQELKKFDGLVFDPPRAGAELQVKQIAKSKVKRVAAVSCNPVTLARDLKILLDGGYQLNRIVPIDQFRFTPHIEVVALLER